MKMKNCRSEVYGILKQPEERSLGRRFICSGWSSSSSSWKAVSDHGPRNLKRAAH